jgi:hypothetical protein
VKLLSGCIKSWFYSPAPKIKASIIHLTTCSCFSKRVVSSAKARIRSLTMGSTRLWGVLFRGSGVITKPMQTVLKEDASSDIAKLHYANKLANLLCNITNELVGLWQDQGQQVVQLVGLWSCQSPTSRHRRCPASAQTRTCWLTSRQLVRIVEFGQ